MESVRPETQPCGELGLWVRGAVRIRVTFSDRPLFPCPPDFPRVEGLIMKSTKRGGKIHWRAPLFVERLEDRLVPADFFYRNLSLDPVSLEVSNGKLQLVDTKTSGVYQSLPVGDVSSVNIESTVSLNL